MGPCLLTASVELGKRVSKHSPIPPMLTTSQMKNREAPALKNQAKLAIFPGKKRDLLFFFGKRYSRQILSAHPEKR